LTTFSPVRVGFVLRGEAGVGKSALLRYLSERVAGWHIASAVGVESEMELAYSGLHQLCAPMLAHLERLPLPQRDALATVFGRSTGPPPDRFLVRLAALTLFTEVAEQRPIVSIVDDMQWLDHASAQIIGFVARRLLAERVALVCAARTGLGDDVLPSPRLWGGSVRSPEEVREVIQLARKNGAQITREPAETFYGGYAGVFRDLDGHAWEVAHNPGFGLNEDGSVRLPKTGS
jgi:AAA ATPase domain